ncbi:MAG: Hpt domain-containing protein, partial [Spirochaetaceae bacterium]|nr:Hpt domain-containing protein [Spirochaetaceae bacterium]
MLDQINEVFFEEANELLESLEGYLLSLEENPTDKEIISAVFRIMHTIKGSSGMFGFDAISSFTHEVESAFDTVRNGTAPVTPELIKLTLQSRDHILDMLGGTISDETSARLIEEFKQLMLPYKNGTAPAVASSQSESSTSTVASADEAIPVMKTTISSSKAEKNSAPQATWRISFTPSPSILCNGTRPSLMINELTEMGDATVILFTKNIPPLSQIEPTTCYLAWDVILTTDQSQQDIQDVFIFLDETSVIKIDSIDVGDEVTHKIGEILINRKHISQETLEEILSERKPIGQMLVEK